jgi:hypothetical protein
MVRSICATTLTLLLSATALAILPRSQDVLCGSRAPSLAVRLGYSAQNKLAVLMAWMKRIGYRPLRDLQRGKRP